MWDATVWLKYTQRLWEKIFSLLRENCLIVSLILKCAQRFTFLFWAGTALQTNSAGPLLLCCHVKEKKKGKKRTFHFNNFLAFYLIIIDWLWLLISLFNVVFFVKDDRSKGIFRYEMTPLGVICIGTAGCCRSAICVWVLRGCAFSGSSHHPGIVWAQSLLSALDPRLAVCFCLASLARCTAERSLWG